MLFATGMQMQGQNENLIMSTYHPLFGAIVFGEREPTIANFQANVSKQKANIFPVLSVRDTGKAIKLRGSLIYGNVVYAKCPNTE